MIVHISEGALKIKSLDAYEILGPATYSKFRFSKVNYYLFIKNNANTEGGALNGGFRDGIG